MGSSTVAIVRDAVSKGCGVGEVAAVRVFKCSVSQNEQRVKRSKGHRIPELPSEPRGPEGGHTKRPRPRHDAIPLQPTRLSGEYAATLSAANY